MWSWEWLFGTPERESNRRDCAAGGLALTVAEIGDSPQREVFSTKSIYLLGFYFHVEAA
jgi:hypothetical protein